MKFTRRLLLQTSGAAAAAGLAGPALAQSAAGRAAQEAKKYAGSTINIVWEAGLQALDPLNFSGPKWEELTGIKVKVVEVQTAEMFTKIMQEYRARTGAYDALNVIPAWMPDLANAGALEVLDPFVEKYGFREELQKIAPNLPRQPNDGEGQDLWPARRRRRVRPLLPQGHLRRSGEPS
jgi:multiple sugar transport system substrate-binding protein